MARFTYRAEDLNHPEHSAEMTARIECALDCDWRYSEQCGQREPAPHFHIIARGRGPDTSERIACLDLDWSCTTRVPLYFVLW